MPDPEAWARKVFDRCFRGETERLLSVRQPRVPGSSLGAMEARTLPRQEQRADCLGASQMDTLWKERSPPVPLLITELLPADGPTVTVAGDREMPSVAQSAAVCPRDAQAMPKRAVAAQRQHRTLRAQQACVELSQPAPVLCAPRSFSSRRHRR